jgi:hypothetical protein
LRLCVKSFFNVPFPNPKKTPGGEPGGPLKYLFFGDQPTLEEVSWLKKRYCEKFAELLRGSEYRKQNVENRR